MRHLLGFSRAPRETNSTLLGAIHWQRMAIPVLALASILLVTACESPRDRQPDSPEATVRDSAGIEIVENHSTQWTVSHRWTVGSQPSVGIGVRGSGIDATRDSSFLAWDIVGLGRLSDGRVAVLSRGENRLLLFEPTGKLSKSIGRAGEGPGEFKSPNQLQMLPGNTLAVWDHPFGPVSHFGSTGVLQRSRHIDFGAVVASTAGASDGYTEAVTLPMPDGSFLVRIHQRGGESRPAGELFRPASQIMRVDSTYAAFAFGRWEEVEQMLPQFPLVWPFPLFPTESHIAVGGNPWSVYISNGDRNEFQEFSRTGVLQRIVRRTTDPIAITDQEREQAEAYAANAGRGLPTDHLPRQEFHPPVNDLLVDTEGYLWVMDKVGQWSVFGRDGIWLGTLEIPLREVHWVDEDLVLGIAHDYETGLNWVEGYRLNRRD